MYALQTFILIYPLKTYNFADGNQFNPTNLQRKHDQNYIIIREDDMTSTYLT